MILESRADLEALLRAWACDNPSGNNILHLAVQKNDVDLVERLVKNGFPVDLENDDGSTAIHLVAETGSCDIASLLLDSGGDIFYRRAYLRKDLADWDNSKVDMMSKVRKAKDVNALEIALDNGHNSLVSVFVRHALQDKIKSERNDMEKYFMIVFMARAFVAERNDILNIFHNCGWTFDRVLKETGRPFLHFVSECANDTRPLKLLLDARADVNATDRGGCTALHVAAQLNRCEDGSVVAYLVKAGARVDLRESIFHGTPLLPAVQGGNLANIRVLLKSGSDPNQILTPDNKKRSLLHIAAQYGNPEVIQLLLEAGANPNVLDDMNGATGLWAVRDNHVAAVRVLFKGGLDPNADDGHSFRIALSLGRLEIAELFVQHGVEVDERCLRCTLDKTNYQGDRFPLFELCARAFKSSKRTADLNQRTRRNLNDDEDGEYYSPDFGIPALMERSASGDSDFALLAATLVEHASVKQLDLHLEQKARALLICICAEKGYTCGVSRLLAVDEVSSEIRNHTVRPFRWTALEIAAFSGNAELAEMLLQNGWGAAQDDISGRSLLHLGAHGGNMRLVQRLLAAGYSADRRDKERNTPFHSLVSGIGGSDLALLKFLHSAGCSLSEVNATGNSVLHLAAQRDHSKTIEWLLKRGVSVDTKNSLKRTALHEASQRNSISAVRVLLNNRASLDQKASDGKTALHLAAESGADEAVEILVQAGASLNIVDITGKTPLATAIQYSACKHTTVATLFSKSTVNWSTPRVGHLVTAATLAQRSASRSANLELVLKTLQKDVGAKNTLRIVRKMTPELVADIIVLGADTGDSFTDVIPLLLDYLPKNMRTRHKILFFFLQSIIIHGGDSDGSLTRRILLLDESNARQQLGGGRELHHLCCKHGRLNQLRIFLGCGLSLSSRVDIDGVSYRALDVAECFSPELVPKIRDLIDTLPVLRDICEKDPEIYPLLRRSIGEEYFLREVVDLSGAFEQDVGDQ